METAEQHNAPQVGHSRLTRSDDIRHKIMERFETFKPHVKGYHDYAEQVSALALEYHEARFREVYPDTAVEEFTLVGTLDARETPKSLDTKLAQLTGQTIKRIIFDRAKGQYHLFI